VLGERRDAVSGLVGDECEAAALPEQQRDERPPESVDAEVACYPRRLGRGLVHAPAEVLPVVELPVVAVVGRDDQGA